MFHDRDRHPADKRTGRSSQRGASLVEYALLVALVAVVCIGAVTFLGNGVSGKMGTAGSTLSGPPTTADWCAAAGWHWEQRGVALVCVP